VRIAGAQKEMAPPIKRFRRLMDRAVLTDIDMGASLLIIMRFVETFELDI